MGDLCRYLPYLDNDISITPFNLGECVLVYICLYMCVGVHACICIDACVCLSVFMSVHRCVWVYVCMFVHKCIQATLSYAWLHLLLFRK